MSASARAARGRLVWAYNLGRPLAILLDYDGTLVPIVEHPRLAKLAAATHRLMERLAGRPRVYLGVLSGRSLDDVREMVSLPDIYYAGSAGLELDLRGERFLPADTEAGHALVARLVQTLAEVASAYSGAWVEDKRFGFTFHYRAVAPDQIETLLARTSRVLQPWTERVHIYEGPMALEVFLALGWTKGTAVKRIIEHVGHAALPFYAGDNSNDADALAAATALGGISMGVGPCAPPAEYHLPDPAALHQFLAGLLDSLETTGYK